MTDQPADERRPSAEPDSEPTSEGAAEPAAEDQRAPDITPDDAARNRGILEALLIASDEPLSAARLTSVLVGVGARDIPPLVDDLNAEYASTGRSFRVTEVAGGFQIMVHAEYGPWVRRLLREKSPARLSQAALETLAILAFRQPITRADVEHVRGVEVDGVLRHLMEKGLVRIAGRSDAPGRPLLYGTTRDFLKHFGLKTLSDLPKLRELEELTQAAPPGPEAASAGDLFPEPASEPEGLRPGSPAAQAEAAPSADPAADDHGDEGEAQPLPGPGGDRLEAGLRPPDTGGTG